MRPVAASLSLAALLLGTASPALGGPRHGDDDDDDQPKRTAVHRSTAATKPAARKARDRDGDDDDRPAPLPASAASPPTKADDDDDRPAAAAVTPAPRPPVKADRDDDDDARARSGPAPGRAADADDDDDDERGPDAKRAIVVTGRRLDAASQRFDRALGAAVYSLANSSIENRPGGEFGTLGQVLQQFPGTATGPVGRLTVRGASGATEVRINNAILPGDGSELIERLSTRLAGSVSLVRGSLPAPFGPGAGSVISLRAKTGHDLAGGQAELQLGRAGTIEPAAEWAGAGERSSLFVTGSLFRSDLGRPAPDADGRPRHDRSRQYDLFGYGEQLLGPDTRAALMVGADDQRFELPNPRALAPLRLAGRARDADRFAVLNLQHAAGALQLQASFSRGWQASFTRPDARLTGVTGGPVQQLHRRGRSGSTQLEAGWTGLAHHALRAGALVRSERDEDRAETFGHGSSAVVSREVERSGSRGAFVSDEWQPNDALTITAGLRADHLRANRTYWQPRLGGSLAAGRGITLHVGYARTVLPFANLQAGAGVLAGGRIGDPAPERDDTVEAGASWAGNGLTLDLSAYRRRMRDAFDLALLEGRPEPVAFSFSIARTLGLEGALTYARGPWSVWANAALTKGWGRGLASGAKLFTLAERLSIANLRVPLGAVRPWNLSAGLVRRVGRLTFSGEVVHQAGLPGAGGGRVAPRLAAQTRVEAAANLRVTGLRGNGLDLRLQVSNLFDSTDPLLPGRGLVALPGFQVGRVVALALEQAI